MVDALWRSMAEAGYSMKAPKVTARRLYRLFLIQMGFSVAALVLMVIFFVYVFTAK